MSLPTVPAPATEFAVEDVVAAAQTAAALVPAPLPLAVDPAADGRLRVAPQATATAFVAPFSGARSGEVVLVLDAGVAEALLADPSGEVDLAMAVRPALEAAAGALGPVVLGPVRTTTAGEADLAVVPAVALLAGDQASAWLALVGTGPAPAASVPAQRAGGSAALGGLDLLRDVEMTLSVEIGRARMTVRELLTLAPGSVVALDRAAGAPADLLVNGRLVARGEVVVVDEDFGLRITEILGAEA